MKILKTNYTDFNGGEVMFIVEGFPKLTFCVKLEGKTTKKQVTDALEAMLPTEDTEEALFNSLKIKKLEGTDI